MAVLEGGCYAIKESIVGMQVGQEVEVEEI
jgi:hypothetical protein